MGSWKKMILGEKMPDKNDPKYAERYEKEVATGRKFARWSKIDRLAGRVQRFACLHPKWFMAIVFGIVLSCFSLNVYRIAQVCSRPRTMQSTTATQHQERLLKQHRGTRSLKSPAHDTDRNQK
jgi:hypothetical protein